MKVLLISGSRNPEGQTARAAQAVLEGAEKAGAETEKIFLPAIEIECCRQCDDDGWGLCSTEGTCIIDDDLDSVFEKFKAADAVILANPVYFGNLSESMRALLDRMRRICFRGGRGAEVEGKAVLGICVAGGGGGGSVECCQHLASSLMPFGFALVDMFPVRRQNLEAKLPQLELAGEWVAGLDEAAVDALVDRRPPPKK